MQSLGLYIVIGVVLLVLVWGVAIYNGLVRAKNQVENAWRQIDVQLKRRHDLIPNLVETVKDYMAYEQETLTRVIEARNRAVAAQGPNEAIPAENALTGALGRLFALAENYPQLKADQSVGRLMEELATTENKIAFARQFYNDSAMANNNRVESFPSNLIANRFGFRTSPYFETPEAEKAVPKVDLR
ncbi:MAG: LemA family protein [Hyphomicrobium sp.]|uniref:LemA family protein n=1 Tax=Hyphomicrobium sp. TaxID=82 RepID=UPI003D09BA7B